MRVERMRWTKDDDICRLSSIVGGDICCNVRVGLRSDREGVSFFSFFFSFPISVLSHFPIVIIISNAIPSVSRTIRKKKKGIKVVV